MIDKRLELYRIAKGLKAKDFAHIIGISPGSYSEIKNGKTSPRADTLEKIIRNTEIDAHWLLTGEGPMIRSTGDETAEKVLTGYKATHSLKPEVQLLVSDLLDILESDDVVMKTAIASSIKAFKESVSRKAKLDESDIETDLKTTGSPGESKQLRDKHRVGGK